MTSNHSCQQLDEDAFSGCVCDLITPQRPLQVNEALKEPLSQTDIYTVIIAVGTS